MWSAGPGIVGLTESEDSTAFKQFEAAGWSRQADSYEQLTGRATAAAAGALLDAARVGAGMRVLDVACGPGHVSATAAARGAEPVGIDISPGMLDAARRAHPNLEFVPGDAEALAFADRSFGAVVGGFVLNHVPRPERAVSEAVRVLVPHGCAAFSVWDRPERTRLMGIMSDAIDRAGLDRSEGVPPGPDGFRLADEDAFARLLEDTGLDQVRIATLELSVSAQDANELWNGLLGGTVRAAAAVLAASEEDRRRVREAFDELAAGYEADDGGLALPAVVKIGSGAAP
jgi:SAM-dependent methyltransferase